MDSRIEFRICQVSLIQRINQANDIHGRATLPRSVGQTEGKQEREEDRILLLCFSHLLIAVYLLYTILIAFGL